MDLSTLHRALSAIVGEANLSVDPEARDLATSDIFAWPRRRPALAVVRPGSTAEIAAVVKALAAASIAIVPRGAGLSYTGGMAVEQDAVVVETTRLSEISIDEDGLVAVIGAGASWEQVAEALKPLGLRSRQPSPISGARSTVGGLASQGLPAGTDGILGLTVVLPSGEVVRTGASASPVRSVPDLTGTFLGDCGAFGIKTEVVLRLERSPSVEFASYDFDDVEKLVTALSTCMREGVASRAFAMDQAKTRQAASVDGVDAVGAALSVMRDAGSLAGAARSAAKLVGFAVSRPAALWSLHLTIESVTPEGAKAQLRRVREICGRLGDETSDVFPRTLHSKPYSVRGMVGPEGERWVPVHGIFRPRDAAEAMRRLRKFLDDRAEILSKAGITSSWLLSSSGPYVLIEPMLYWRDSLDPLHLKYLSGRNRERFGSFAPVPAVRDVARELRQGLRDEMDALGAVHCQIGRFYNLEQQQADGSFGELRKLKARVDPAGLLNPGVLGLDQEPAKART